MSIIDRRGPFGNIPTPPLQDGDRFRFGREGSTGEAKVPEVTTPLHIEGEDIEKIERLAVKSSVGIEAVVDEQSQLHTIDTMPPIIEGGGEYRNVLLDSGSLLALEEAGKGGLEGEK